MLLLIPDLQVSGVVMGVEPDGVGLPGVAGKVEPGQYLRGLAPHLQGGGAGEQLEELIECVYGEPVVAVVLYVRHVDIQLQPQVKGQGEDSHIIKDKAWIKEQVKQTLLFKIDPLCIPKQ